MLDPAFVRERLDEVKEGLRRRGLDADAELKAFLDADAERRALIPEVEGLKREQNAASEEVAQAKREGRDPSGIFAANKARGQRIKDLERRAAEIDDARTRALSGIPNLPHASVPVGTSAADNVEVRRSGEPRAMDFEPKPHWELGAALGILDFERAARSEEHTFEL